MPIRQRTHAARPTLALESLEQRVLLASPIGIVGFEQTASGTSSYAIDAQLSDSGSIIGLQTDSGVATPGSATTPFLSAAEFSANESLSLTFDGSFMGFDTVDGAGFLSSRGSPLGWFLGRDSGDSRFGFGLAVERPAETDLDSLAGTYALSILRIPPAPTGSGPADFTALSYTGSLNLGALGQGTILATTADGGPAIVDPIAFTTFGTNGRFDSSDGQIWFANADYSILIGVDTTTGDTTGQAHTLTIAYRAEVSPAGFSGDAFRIALANDQETADDPNRDIPASAVVRLESGGAASFLNADDFDAGTITVLGTGSYTVTGSGIVLTSPSGNVSTYTIVSGSDTLIATTSGSGTVIGLFGLGSKAQDVPVPLQRDEPVATVEIGTDGRIRFYELIDAGTPSESWEVTDLRTAAAPGASLDAALGAATSRGTEFFTDPVTGEVTVAWNTSAGLYLFERDGTAWTIRRLDSGSAVTAIVSDFTVYELPGTATSGDELAVISGVNINGDFIQFRQDGTTDADDLSVWNFVDISGTQLDLGGQVSPAFVSNLTSFSTPWGGETIAGLTSDGNLWAVWFAPGLVTWRSLNLTSNFGPSATLTGSVTSWTQEWGGLNIAGHDSSGNTIVYWWSPALGSNWRVANLSVEASAPATSNTGSIAAATLDDGSVALAVVLDDPSAETVVFRWDASGDLWTASTVSTGLASGEARPTADFQVLIEDGDIYVFGTTPASERIGLSLVDPDPWTFEVLPDIATPV